MKEKKVDEISIAVEGLPLELTAFVSRHSSDVQLHIEVDLTNLVDGHDYHDSPSSVDMWLDEERLDVLIADLNKIKQAFAKLKGG